MNWHSIIAAGAALAWAFGPIAAHAGEVLDRVMSRGVMVMSTDPEYPPQSFLNERTSSKASTSTWGARSPAGSASRSSSSRPAGMC
jgi:hypothetical protein